MIIYLKGDGGLDLSGSSKHNEKWLNFGRTLNLYARGFAFGLGE